MPEIPLFNFSVTVIKGGLTGIGLVIGSALGATVMGPDYTVTDTDDLVSFLAGSSFVHQTASANSSLVVNTTPGSVAGGYGLPDPQIPPLPHYGLRITDTTVTDTKVKIVVIGGVHAREQSGSHLLDGFLRKLVDGSPEMQSLLQWAEFFVYPQVNPEGRYGYNQPGNPHGIERDAPSNLGVGAFDEDLNRIWEDPTGWPQIVAIQSIIVTDTGGAADYYFDFHARSFTLAELAAKNPSEGPKQIWVPQALMTGPFIQSLTARDASIEVYPSGTKPGQMSSREWAMSSLGLSAPQGYTPECARDEAPAFYQDFGATFALALFDVLQPSLQPVPDCEGASLMIDFNDANTPGGNWTTLEALNTDLPLAFPGGGITGAFSARIEGDWLNTSGNTGQASANLADPSLAAGAQDYFFITGEDSQGTVTFSGLSAETSYKIEVVASRSNPGSIPKTGDYTVNGLAADSDGNTDDDNGIDFDVHLDGFTDGDILTWDGVTPDGSNQITFRAVSDVGTGSNGSNVYINAIRITEVLVYSEWLQNYPQLTGMYREGTADADRDGLDNKTEMLVGTDPDDSNSRIQLSLDSSRNFLVPTQQGRWYSLEQTSDLTDPESWTELGRWGPGDGNEMIIPVEFTPGFYRSGVYLTP